MSELKLYTELAEIYDQLYYTLFDYEKDADFIEKILGKYNIREILELGCGTGHLTSVLVTRKYKVTAIDLYEEMLLIAQRRLPDVHFFRQDIRKLHFDQTFESIVTLGRTFAYIVKNDDLEKCIRSFWKVLNPGGILVLDSFSAPHFIRNFKEHQEMIHEASNDNRRIRRISNNTWNLKQGVTFNWNALYEIEENGSVTQVVDESVLRCFFPEELTFFLKQAGFQLLDIYDADYAFTITARKLE